MSTITVNPIPLATGPALIPALTFAGLGAQCLTNFVNAKEWKNVAAITNAVGTVVFYSLSILYSCATSEVLVRAFAVPTQAMLTPWAVGAVFVLKGIPVLADAWAGKKNLGHQVALGSVAAISVLTLFFNGLD